MPKYEHANTVNGLDTESILSVCYSSFINLSWKVQFAGEDSIVAITPKSWKGNSQRIVSKVAGNQLTISSEMTGGELLDLAKRNRKNVDTFFSAFESSKTLMQSEENENNLKAIAALREETTRIAAEEQAEAVEVAKAMNLSGSNLYATYAIIALNLIVFVLMAINGAGIMEANGLVHIKWGSNFAPLTLSGDWWRLITNIFIHFGIIHLAMNMYAFYMVSIYLEPMLGKQRYIVAYLCTGVLASIVSLWWHTTPVNSAGASGAIFGMYGVFLAFLTTKLIPEKVRKALLQSIGIFVVYNLIYGMKGGIDNSAHIGGLVSGFIIGYFYIAVIKKEKQDPPGSVTWLVPVILLTTVAITFFYLQQHKINAEDRNLILTEVKNANYKDNKKFDAAYDHFIELQDTALLAMNDTTLTDDARNIILKEKALPLWNEAAVLAAKMQTLDVSKQAQRKADNVAEYIALRKQEIAVIDSMVTGKAGISSLQAVRHSIHLVLQELK